MKGLFITFEGGEGAGKTTQADILVKRLQKEGYQVVTYREPGGTHISEQIRQITHNPENTDMVSATETYLMAASRAQLVAEHIKPDVERGVIIVCDRFLDSSLAYQGYGRGLGEDMVYRLNELAISQTLPDVTFLLNVPVAIGLARRNESVKVKDRLDKEKAEFYEKVYQGYLALAKKFENRYVVIDATKSVPDVANDIWTAIKEKLPKQNA